MESGEITSDQIMASSKYNPSWSSERSRLNYYENAWTPAEDSNKEWIQVRMQWIIDDVLLGNFFKINNTYNKTFEDVIFGFEEHFSSFSDI